MRRIAADLIFLVALVAGTVIGWWELYPYNVGWVQEAPFTVITPVVQPGGTLIVRGWACRWMNSPGFVYRRFVDGLVYNAPGVVMSFRMGCRRDDEDLLISVPPNLPKGVYHVESDIRFQVNPMRAITYHYSTDQFEVVAPAGPGAN